MKNPKSTLALILLFVGMIAFVLQNQQVASQSSPPPISHSFNAHYSELDLRLGLGRSARIQLPVANRTVRIAISMIADQDGEVAFLEVPSLYSVNPGFEGFTMQLGTIYVTEASQNNLFVVSGGTNQSFVVSAAGDKSGSLHVSMWY